MDFLPISILIVSFLIGIVVLLDSINELKLPIYKTIIASVNIIVAVIFFALYNTVIKNDATLALILAGFFGLGRMLLSVVERSSGSGAAGLDSFIFGQTATILLKDLYLIIGIAVIVNLLIIMFWKEFKLQTFNQEFFNTSGFSSRLIEIIF